MPLTPGHVLIILAVITFYCVPRDHLPVKQVHDQCSSYYLLTMLFFFFFLYSGSELGFEAPADTTISQSCFLL